MKRIVLIALMAMAFVAGGGISRAEPKNGVPVDPCDGCTTGTTGTTYDEPEEDEDEVDMVEDYAQYIIALNGLPNYVTTTIGCSVTASDGDYVNTCDFGLSVGEVICVCPVVCTTPQYSTTKCHSDCAAGYPDAQCNYH